MLIKAKIINNITIYRKGIGYLLKLYKYSSYFTNSFLYKKKLDKNFIYWVLKNYTNIKHYKLYYIFTNKNKVIELIKSIMDFNIDKSENKKENKNESFEESIFQIIDIICSNYNITPDYILEKMDIFELKGYIKAINKRNNMNYKINMMIAHNPEALIQTLNESENIKKISWAEFFDNIQKDN